MISILIPNFNRAILIIETLESIKNQCYTDWECIIIDDGSTDNSFKAIQEAIYSDDRFRLFKRPQYLKKGPSSCRNFAFEKSKGDFIQFFDSDDIMHPDHLQEKFEKIAENDFVVCKLMEFENKFDFSLLEEETSEVLEQEKNVFFSFVTGAFPMMMVAPMWKKSIIDKHMPIREDLHILEDHELYARILSNKVKYSVINKSLIYYRVGSESITNSFFKDVSYGLDSYFVAKKTVLSICNSDEIRLAILKMILGIFRIALAQKQYSSAEKIFEYIAHEKLAYSITLKIKMFRIKMFYAVIKIIGRGDTFCKPFLKL